MVPFPHSRNLGIFQLIHCIVITRNAALIQLIVCVCRKDNEFRNVWPPSYGHEMKRAYIENFPHNLEAQTITVSGGSHWAGRQITVGRTSHATGWQFNSFCLEWNCSFIETSYPLRSKIHTMNKLGDQNYHCGLLVISEQRRLRDTILISHPPQFTFPPQYCPRSPWSWQT